jgi:RHS repeat-associated protein
VISDVTTYRISPLMDRTNVSNTSYYWFAGWRIAMRSSAGLSYLYADKLGSTMVTTGTVISDERYTPWGTARDMSQQAAVPYRYTGQREEAALGLYDYGARWYDPSIGRFIQADTIVPEPANPQNLNRYSYALNNPLKYTDPTGYDPLDAEWWKTFKSMGREPSNEDILIRLFSLAFPDWFKWSDFYDENNNYIKGSIDAVFRIGGPEKWSWNDIPSALSRLASWYKPGEKPLFDRDVGTLFGGLANRFEQPNPYLAFSNSANPIRAWVAVSQGSMPRFLTGTSDTDANIHHWAWVYMMAGSIGATAQLINTGREDWQFISGIISRGRPDFINRYSDVTIGALATCMAIFIPTFAYRIIPGD